VSASATKVPFIDLRREYARLKGEIDAAVQGVLTRGWFILGPENTALEEEYARYCQAKHGVLLATGTDAIALALRAGGVGPGDEVITVSHTAVATVAAIRLTGAQPVLVDVDDETLTIDPAAVERAISPRTKAVIAVHLYGQPADLGRLSALTAAHRLLLIEDCAQAQGASIGGRAVGSIGAVGAFSFYPTKNIGAYGDGGAIVTNDDEVAARVRLLRQYGWGKLRYISETEGTNSRMDELQAAIVRAKLRVAADDERARQGHARAYDEGLRGLPLRLPARVPATKHAFHLYVVRTPLRDELKAHLAQRGIDTAIHYPAAVHQQAPYREMVHGTLANTERAVREILSLPLYPDLRPAEAQLVIDEIRAFFSGRRA
jgi:dTDP-4-amino-4,6-dideoxygalactose transaminase